MDWILSLIQLVWPAVARVVEEGNELEDAFFDEQFHTPFFDLVMAVVASGALDDRSGPIDFRLTFEQLVAQGVLEEEAHAKTRRFLAALHGKDCGVHLCDFATALDNYGDSMRAIQLYELAAQRDPSLEKYAAEGIRLIREKGVRDSTTDAD